MNELQIKASNPEISTWVSASAGTGKTKILTDRVLRLLLSGTKLDKILCLTFTNAAAEEMKERIASSLEKWANFSDSKLKQSLQLTMGTSPDTGQLDTAKNLYNYYLKSEKRINIQTIHSFCQKTLTQFPLEAGIAPGFKVIDEIKASLVLQKIRSRLFLYEDIKPISEYLVTNFHDLIIDEILSDIISNKEYFTQDNCDIQDICIKATNIISELNKDNQEDFQIFWEYKTVQNLIGYNPSSAEIINFFLTKQGLKKKRIVTQKIAKPGSSLYEELEFIQNEVFLLDQKHKATELEHHSELLSMLATKILFEYNSYKTTHGYLDYDDLITYTNDLLSKSDARDWVMYKLDGGIHHLLVDEAQDTSPKQWFIVQNLIEEFYAGDSGKDEENRTIFIVGDEKQSIFSFQGANVDSFQHMNALLKQKMLEGGKLFDNIALKMSYRSCPEIIEVVDNIFSSIKLKMPDMFKASFTKMTPFRKGSSGSVELWPLEISTQKDDFFWPNLLEDNDSSSKIKLAKKIANYIKKTIASKVILPATKMPVCAADFMLLFRKRDEFTEKTIQALQEANIPVNGLDRITLKDNLAIKDLLSVAKFVINPEDNLNIACLLKSSFIHLSEEEIYLISTARKKDSIWSYVSNHTEYNELLEKLLLFINLYKQYHVGNFFQHLVDVLGYRADLLKYSGPGANDAIDEFLYVCNSYSNSQDTSVQNFIFWLEGNDSSIKRDNNNANSVRIMTVHGSKGLQAPIVILCDTTSLPSSSDRFIQNTNGQALSAKNSSRSPEYFKELKQIEKDKTYAEYLRLLYVALTRAEDKLIIAGYKQEKELPDNSWYKIVEQSMLKIGKIDDDHYIYGVNSFLSTASLQDNSVNAENIEYFKPETQAKNTQIEDKTDPTASNNNYAQYGTIFHKIMEDSLLANSLQLANSHPLIMNLNKIDKKRMMTSIEKIISNKNFTSLLQHDYETEVSIGTYEGEKSQLKRIDLLVFKQDSILIIDYKSDKKPANDINSIPLHYLDQLDNYKNVISKIYPNNKIEKAILWLENGKLVFI